MFVRVIERGMGGSQGLNAAGRLDVPERGDRVVSARAIRRCVTTARNCISDNV